MSIAFPKSASCQTRHIRIGGLAQRVRSVVVFLATTCAAQAIFCGRLAAQGSEPRIVSLSPSSITAGSSAITLTVNGERFGNAGQGAVVRWNGVNRSTTYVSVTQLRVSLPSSDLAQAGKKEVTVFLPLGTGILSAPAMFTVNNPVPVISALSPTAKPVGTAFVLTVTGSAFAAGSAVHWNGTARTTTRVSATQLTANLSATDLAAPGNYSVTVVNPAPGGGASAARSFSVVDPPRITAFYIGGPNNPRRVWAGERVPLDVMRAGSTPTHWRIASSASALPAASWQGVAGVAYHTFTPWRANDCGLTDPTQYRHSERLHFQYAAVAGGDTILSAISSDSVIVRLPWCSPITANPPVAWAGFLTSNMSRSVCAQGTLMNGVRVRTAQVRVAFTNMTIVTAVGAVCGGSNGPLVGTTEGEVTVNTNFGTVSAPFVQIFRSSLRETLAMIMVLPAPLPAGLQGGVTYPPLASRVIDANVSGGAGSTPWTMTCPNGTAPIGMYVYRNDQGRAIGLSLLCVRPDN